MPRGRLPVAATLTIAAAAVTADERTTSPPSQLSPLLAQSLSPLLADWIALSRDSALRQGVEPIPDAIRTALAGYVPEDVLAKVRWRQGGADDMSLQTQLVQFGDVPAMTLDYVIVFKHQVAALEDPKLWAHELKHVMQFAEWGIAGFAQRYVTDYSAVEQEAAEFRWQFMKQAGLVPPVPSAGDGDASAPPGRAP